MTVANSLAIAFLRRQDHVHHRGGLLQTDILDSVLAHLPIYLLYAHHIHCRDRLDFGLEHIADTGHNHDMLASLGKLGVDRSNVRREDRLFACVGVNVFQRGRYRLDRCHRTPPACADALEPEAAPVSEMGGDWYFWNRWNVCFPVLLTILRWRRPWSMKY